MTKLLVIIFLLVAAQFSSGHGLNQSLEMHVNGYFIDVGYDAADKIYSGDAVRFDFNLLKENSDEVAEFSHIWIRISPKESGIVFAGFLYRPEFLLTGMTYSFPNPGDYEITVRYLDKDDKSLAEATFPLEVVANKSAWSNFISVENIVVSIMGIIVGAVITGLLLRKNKTAL